jgi:hypothetical protein
MAIETMPVAITMPKLAGDKSASVRRGRVGRRRSSGVIVQERRAGGRAPPARAVASPGYNPEALMSDILTHVEAGVMTLTFNRVDKKNSITRAMYAALADGLEQAAQDAAVRVVLIQGDATVFSAGNDIGDFQAAPADPGPREQQPVWRFLRAIASFPKPIVAAVCGPAVGVGTTLLLHCDLVYAGDNAAFALPFVNLGLCPRRAPACCCRKCSGCTARPRPCCWASPSWPRRRWRWAWSTAWCRPPNATPSPRARRASWRPSR